jgi:hypothetical protein
MSSKILKQHLSKPRQMMISLSKDYQLTDWLRDQLIAMITPRYKIGFMAMDMDVTYHQLWRFMRGEHMHETFINKAFRFLLNSKGEILEQ